MKYSILKTWSTSRNLYSDYLNNHSLEQLNKIPEGFNNNLVWNIGHIIVAQQSIIYRLSNLKMNITDELYDLYKSGTKPARTITQNELTELKSLLFSLVEYTKLDYEAGKFITFNERLTGTGFMLSSLNDAFEFVNYHEGIHLGIMSSIKKHL